VSAQAADPAQRFAARFAATQARRAAIRTRPNPHSANEYLIGLEGMLSLPGSAAPLRVKLRFVPDRLVLESAGFAAYLAAVAAQPWTGAEDLATAMLEDLSNELVAKWTQIALRTRRGPESGRDDHTVLVEERQPRWDNPSLLARLDEV